MNTIYIFGLGPSELGEMPKRVYDTISKQEQLYLRTIEHPAAKELAATGLNITSFDDVYEEYNEDFGKIYPAIVEKLIEAAQTADVYYGVPGHPAVAEASVQLLLKSDIPTKIIGGKSFIDDLFAAVKIDPIEGFLLVDSYDLNTDTIFPGHHLIIMQVFHSLIAGNVKLDLMEVYPADHQICVIDAAGSPNQVTTWMALFELDYFDGVHNLRSVYVPPLARDEATRSMSTMYSYVDEIFGDEGDVWIKKQTGAGLLKYFQEELDELKEAYTQEDTENIIEELGDLLMQVLYQAKLAETEDLFTFEDVLETINKKLRRRHPHVFDGVSAKTPAEVDALWQEIKKQEQAEE